MFKKKVLIHAFLLSNLGDDLLVKHLCRRYPKTQFYIVAGASYKNTFKDISNLKVYDYESKKVKRINEKFNKKGIVDGFKLNLATKMDAVVHIGGSVFHQHSDDWRPFFNYDKSLLENSKKFYQVGSNFGPYKDPKFFECYYELFKKYEGITFRDEYSYRLFRDLKNVSFAPDVLFGLPVKADRDKEKSVVISVINLEDRAELKEYESTYISFIKEVIENFGKRGYTIKLVSFCEAQGDTKMAEKIKEKLPLKQQSNVNIYTYNDNDELILELFEKAGYCVGTRFHSVVFGLLCKCKTIPLIYNDKTEGMLKDLDSTSAIDIKDMGTITKEEIEKAIEGTKVYEDIAEVSKEANNQFVFLDGLLR